MGRLCALLLALAVPNTAWAQLPVTDAAAAAQRAVQLFNQGLAYIRQGQQILNEATQIRQQVEMILNQIRNLQRMPAGLNMLDSMTAYGNQASSLLGQATRLSYTLDHAMADFTGLYVDLARAYQQGGSLVTKRQDMVAARLEASMMAVQAQAIRSNMTSLYERLCDLLNGSYAASGNLDSQQIAAQQRAIQTQTMQNAALVQATAFRVQTMEAAERAALQNVAILHMQALTNLGPIGDWHTGPQPDMLPRGSLENVWRAQ